jgi:hypothetical protein
MPKRKRHRGKAPEHNNPPTPEWLLERRRQDVRAYLARTTKAGDKPDE